MANLKSSTTLNSKKLFPDNNDNDRQPEIAIQTFSAPILSSLLQSLVDTFFELIMVVSTRFAVRISMLCDIQVFPVSVAISGCHASLKSWEHSLSSPWSKTPGLPLKFWWYLLYFRRYKYFRFGGHIAISGFPSPSKLLSLSSPWPIMLDSQLKRKKLLFS